MVVVNLPSILATFSKKYRDSRDNSRASNRSQEISTGPRDLRKYGSHDDLDTQVGRTTPDFEYNARGDSTERIISEGDVEKGGIVVRTDFTWQVTLSQPSSLEEDSEHSGHHVPTSPTEKEGGS